VPPNPTAYERVVLFQSCAQDCLSSAISMVQKAEVIGARLIDRGPNDAMTPEEVISLRRISEHMIVHASAVFDMMHPERSRRE